MRVTEYPEFSKHKKEHQDFIARVADEKKHAVSTGNLSLDMMYFLRDWLVDHILVSDKHFAEVTRRSTSERGSFTESSSDISQPKMGTSPASWSGESPG